MKHLLIIKTIIIFTISILPVALADEPRRKGLIKDEIKTHVIDECGLYTRHNKNRFDFPPLEVVHILSDIHNQTYKIKAALVEQVYSVVRTERSFYRRSRIYDVFYGLCVGKIPQNEAEIKIVRIMEQPIEQNIQSMDNIVYSKFISHNMHDKAKRDRNRIDILNRANARETESYIVLKNKSVIQEYKYDIELWE